MKIWKDHSWAIVMLIFAGVVFMAVFLHYLIYFNGIFPDSDACINNDCNLDVFREKFSHIGDYFGGVLGAIFSFLSFIAVLVTYQSNKDASREQASLLKVQKFENTFFSILDQHNRLLDKIMAIDENGYSILTSIKRVFTGGIRKNSSNFLKESKDMLLTSQFIGQYFRVLYQVLKFIFFSFNPDGSYSNELTNEEKSYASLVRSFLTNDVYFLLAINCYCESDEDMFYSYKKLVERYSFLEHLRPNERDFIFGDIACYYEVNAFGDNQVLLNLKNKKS